MLKKFSRQILKKEHRQSSLFFLAILCNENLGQFDPRQVRVHFNQTLVNYHVYPLK